MIDAEILVCTECGNLHMAGGGAPDRVEDCAVCEAAVTDVEVEDLVNLNDVLDF